jgi:hypothetical protein
MATKITRTTTPTTTALITAFALVGVIAAGVVPTAFAQTSDDPLTGSGGLLDQFLEDTGSTDGTSTDGGTSDRNGITDGTETTRDTTEQTEDQSEQNRQSNSLNQDQTAAVNEEIGTGSGSEVASAASSDAESTYKTKNKDGGSSPIPGESTAASDSTSDVSNNGTIAQDQTLSSPTQINSNDFGSDELRNAAVGFDLGFEQFTEQTGSAEPDIATRAPIVVP